MRGNEQGRNVRRNPLVTVVGFICILTALLTPVRLTMM